MSIIAVHDARTNPAILSLPPGHPGLQGADPFLRRFFQFGPGDLQGQQEQPEMRGELQGLMLLGLALTEAITFYALLMSFVAFFIGK